MMPSETVEGGAAPITLLNRGNLVARMGENQQDLDKQIPIDYFMSWIEKKT